MDGDAHSRVTPLTRLFVIVSACSADIIVNYPLWIYAKRIMAGLSRPRLGEIYKGAGSLLFSCGPMMTLQDHSTHFILQRLGDDKKAQNSHFFSACVSGAVGGLFVGAQVESVITRAHAQRETVWRTFQSTYAKKGGLAALALPYGALMVAAREVPYAGTMFFLSHWIRTQLNGGDELGAHVSTSHHIGRDLLTAFVSAAIVGPISHAPSVIASHQQANNVTISTACREMYAAGGFRSFYRGIIPRTITLAGSLFVIPITIAAVQPMLE